LLEFFYRHTKFRKDYEKATQSKDISIDINRGVFHADFCVNSREFLRCEIEEPELIWRKMRLDEQIAKNEREIDRILKRIDRQRDQEVSNQSLQQLNDQLSAKLNFRKSQLPFDTGDTKSIVKYWKEKHGLDRFRDMDNKTPQNSDLRKQSYMTVRKRGGIMTAEEFIEANQKRED